MRLDSYICTYPPHFSINGRTILSKNNSKLNFVSYFLNNQSVQEKIAQMPIKGYSISSWGRQVALESFITALWLSGKTEEELRWIKKNVMIHVLK